PGANPAAIRGATCHAVYSAHQGVEHDDLNVLCLGSEVVGPALSVDLIRAFLHARFDGGEPYVTRLRKIEELERGTVGSLKGESVLESHLPAGRRRGRG